MKIKEYLENVAYIVGDKYFSRYDDSYMTHVGMEDQIKFLAEKEIIQELTHGVGFSPKDGKWYGWSHRSIYGFKIGSTCKKGDCHYFTSNEKDEMENAINFWSGKDHKNVAAKKIKEGELEISWTYGNKIKNKELRGTISSVVHHYNPKFGRGEWKAKTIEDAKQMAIDFNEGVS